MATKHPVVSREQWLSARKQLLAQEKELTRQRDALHRQRQALPWVTVDKTYVFDGPNGQETLSDLFNGKSQLIVQHFMFGPDWTEGCVGCSFKSDHIDGALVHLQHRDVEFVSVSRAPFPKIDAYRQRMGWKFKWASSYNSDFNFDYGVSFKPGDTVTYNYRVEPYSSDELAGVSAFYKDDDGAVYHTYSTYGRGDELLVGAYNYLDIAPKGRDETGNPPMGWIRRHDEYEREPVRLAKSAARDTTR